MKKSIGIIFISLLLCGTVAASSINYNKNTMVFDELDQSQTETDGDGLWVGSYVGELRQAAQSFIPQKGILTRVELYITRWRAWPSFEPFYLAIRETITGDNLAEISIDADGIPFDDFVWKEFDITDILVTAGEEYFLIADSPGGPNHGMYIWASKNKNPYVNGMAFISEDEGLTWDQQENEDLCFKTYGIDNDPPNKPSITGITEGSPGISYNYTFSAVEPDGENVKFLIDWDDGDQYETDYIASGESITVNHSWASKGFYSIKAKAIDVLDKESEWETLKIRMPKNQQVSNMWFLEWMGRHPILNQIVNLLMDKWI